MSSREPEGGTADREDDENGTHPGGRNSRDPFKEDNEYVRRLAARAGFRTRECGDGELVIRTCGDRTRPGFWSKEGNDRWALVVLCHPRPGSAITALRRRVPTLVDKSTETDLYAQFTEEEALLVMEKGPRYARARKKRVVSAEAAARGAENFRKWREKQDEVAMDDEEENPSHHSEEE